MDPVNPTQASASVQTERKNKDPILERVKTIEEYVVELMGRVAQLETQLKLQRSGS